MSVAPKKSAAKRKAKGKATTDPLSNALAATQAAVLAWIMVPENAFTDDDSKTVARSIIASWFAVISGDKEEAGRINRRARDYIHKQRKRMQRDDDAIRSVITFDEADVIVVDPSSKARQRGIARGDLFQAWAIDPCEWDRGRAVRNLQRIVMDALAQGRSADRLARLLLANEATSTFDVPRVDGDRDWFLRVWDADWSPPTRMVKAIERAMLNFKRSTSADLRAEKIITDAVVALGAARQRVVGLFKRNALDTR